MKDHKDAENGNPGTIRPVTRSLILAIILDMPPTPAAATDFGIKSQEHYEAIYYPFRHGEISAAQLDAAYGNGPKLTTLVNAASRNPHTGITFQTPWDNILPRENAAKDNRTGLAGLKTGVKTAQKESRTKGIPGRSKSHDQERER
jgi:hypothetical protein